jgi:hypothetical protein
MTTTKQPLALKLADELDQKWWRWKENPTTELKAATELRRQHAELYQWESVFRHLGTADECGNEWIGLQAEVEALRSAITKLHKAKGRYHTQLAVCDLFELCGLTAVRPARAGEKK